MWSEADGRMATSVPLGVNSSGTPALRGIVEKTVRVVSCRIYEMYPPRRDGIVLRILISILLRRVSVHTSTRVM